MRLVPWRSASAPPARPRHRLAFGGTDQAFKRNSTTSPHVGRSGSADLSSSPRAGSPDEGEPGEGTVPFRRRRVEVRMKPHVGQPRRDRVDAIEQPPVMSTGVAHEIQYLEPIRRLRRPELARSGDSILNVSTREAVEVGQTPPVHELGRRPNGRSPVVLLMMVPDEALP